MLGGVFDNRRNHGDGGGVGRRLRRRRCHTRSARRGASRGGTCRHQPTSHRRFRLFCVNKRVIVYTKGQNTSRAASGTCCCRIRTTTMRRDAELTWRRWQRARHDADRTQLVLRRAVGGRVELRRRDGHPANTRRSLHLNNTHQQHVEQNEESDSLSRTTDKSKDKHTMVRSLFSTGFIFHFCTRMDCVGTCLFEFGVVGRRRRVDWHLPVGLTRGARNASQ